MSATLPAVQPKVQEAVTLIRQDAFLAQVATALPGTVTPDRFVRVLATAIYQNPELAGADRQSLLNAAIRAAQDGLLPDGREAALVIFGGKATYMPMVGGVRKIAAQHGISLSAFVVFALDEFDYELGMNPTVTHKPPPLDHDRGEPIGAYAVATDSRGQKHLDVMSRQEIEQVRKASKSGGSGPWKDWWAEMARKTVARRLFKQLPLGDLNEREARVIEAADDADFRVRINPEWTREEAQTVRALGKGFEPPATSGPDDTTTGVVSPAPKDPSQGDGVEGAEPGTAAQAPSPDDSLFQEPDKVTKQRRAASKGAYED